MPFSFDQATKDAYRKILSVTTTGVSLATGLASNGYALLLNLDAVHFVSVGGYPGSVLDSVIKLSPGYFALLPLDPAATIRLQADTATCLVDVRCWSR